MFLEKFSKTQLNVIAIVSITLATIMLILVITLPILLKRKKTNDFTQKCSPTMDNTKLWAEFPGDLNSKITHKYLIFNYTELNDASEPYKIDIHSEFSINEEVKYENFEQDGDTIYFDANRNYFYIDENKEEKKPINSINMGLFEALETMTYPPLYKVGINSIYYLISKTLIEPDIFLRELFTYKIFNKMTEEKEKIFNNISAEKIDIIFSDDNKYKKYSLKNKPGFFEWIKILGIEDKISKAIWLSELFNLTYDEITSILGKNSYLDNQYQIFYLDLCENKEKCDNLLYTQLIDGSVITSLELGVKDYLSLNKELETNYYPFDSTPEMIFYFEEEFKKKINDKNSKFEDYSPSINQLSSLLELNSSNCLLSPQNSIYLLHINKTEEKKNDKKYILDLTYNKIKFLAEYFYDFLPSIFLYPKINTENSKNIDTNIEQPLNIEPVSKTISTMIQNIADKTYKYMPKIYLYDYILKKTLFHETKKKTKSIELDEICPIIMQKILDDGKKVNKICTDENIGFNSEESLYKWIEPYYCLSENRNDTKCNMYIINYLKELVYISEDEINQIFGEGSLGGIISDSLEIIKNNYQCGDRCEEDGYLNKLQFWTGIVTSNASEPFEKTDTIKDWFPDTVPYPIEISFYQKKYGKNDNFTEQDINYIINLVLENGNIFDLENSNSFNAKLKLEKVLSLYMNNKENPTSLVTLIQFLIDVFVFKNENNSNDNNDKQSLIVKYSSLENLLKGNNLEDKQWIDYLSSGNYFTNFKPEFNKTTGFQIGIDLDTKAQDYYNFDNYGINIKSDPSDKRRINKMNDLLTLNIKKKEFDYVKGNYVNIISPTFNFEKLLDDRQFSDGFQYAHDLKTIYYYDIISSRPLRFIHSKDNNYENKILCRRYDLDTNDLSLGVNEKFDLVNKNSMLVQKVNKPFMISTDFVNLKSFGYNYNENDNYICVDPITDMVIDSKINLIYQIYTRNYKYVNEMIGKKELYPIFIYQRNYEVEVKSYEEQFPGVTEYYKNIYIFIIFGIIFIVLLIVIAFLSFIYLKKSVSKKESLKQSLVPLTDSGLDSNRDSDK